jgi:hypothetical protein
MSNAIEKLRELNGVEGRTWDETYEKIDDLLCPYNAEYTSTVVHKEFEEGGRWYNIEEEVYRISENDEVAYFELWQHVPASETQEGMDLSYGFYEVVPEEVVAIKYVAK